jgi:uncharacterized SAM-binding protein YcdF (DUF218 family)
MKEVKSGARIRIFWWIEAALLGGAVFFGFALIGYRFLALLLLCLTALTGLYHLLFYYGRKKPRRARRLKAVLTALVLTAALCFSIPFSIVAASAKTDSEPEAPYLLILGAGVNGTVPSLSLHNRLTAAKMYLETYPEARAILSGGQGPGEEITEAECMRRWLEAAGIFSKRLILEEQSTSTQENIQNSLAILEAMGEDPRGRLAIVSSEYHLYRAKLVAKELGAEPVGVAAKTTKPILKLNYMLREAAAVLLMWIM